MSCDNAGHTGHASKGTPAATTDVPIEPEELRCLHCGYALYGLGDNRCPECGEPFKWDDVRAAARGVRADLFEHHWYDNPAASIVRSWGLAAFRPFKLWACYSEHDRPRVGPLLAFILVQAAVFAYGWQTMALGIDPFMNYLARTIQSAAARNVRFIYTFRPGSAFLEDIAIWYLATFLALQLFYESKRMYGVRWRQILRVYAHATALAALCPAAWCVLEALVDATHFFGAPGIVVSGRAYDLLGDAMFVIGVTSAWVALWIGYRKYLRMPHGWAIAGLSMFIGYLMTDLVDMLTY
jgi:hypothetical protein